jgi:N utilization substance protein B
MALQALYRVEITGDESPEGLELLWENFQAPPEARRFAVELVQGVVAERERIDQLIAEAAEHWSLSRIARVDLNVMRIAIYEMLARVNPPGIAIDEAIEIARRYGGEESAQFVNGILDHVAGVLGLRDPEGRIRPA